MCVLLKICQRMISKNCLKKEPIYSLKNTLKSGSKGYRSLKVKVESLFIFVFGVYAFFLAY